MRGFGAVQTCFAAEAQMDKLAAALEIDPIELRLLNALEPGGVLATGQVITGSLPTKEVIRRAAALAVPEPEELPRDAIRLPGGAGNTTRGEGVRRGVGFAVGFKNVCYSEGFDDFCTARVKLSAAGDAEVHCAAAEVGQGVSDVILEVARRELGTDDVVLAAGHDRGSRLRRLRVGVAHDVDGGRAPCSSRAERPSRSRSGDGGGEVDVERVYRHPRTFPLDPETGQTTGERPHVAFAVAAMRVVVEVDVELGLTRVVWIGTAQDVGTRSQPDGCRRADRGRNRPGPRTGADGGDPDPRRSDHERELHGLPDSDLPRHAAGRLRARRGPRARRSLRREGRRGAADRRLDRRDRLRALRDATGRELARVPVRPDDIVGL